MENDFENKMENLQTPKPDFVKHQEMFKIGLMNAKKSSRIGIIFILLPALFIVLVYLKYQFLIRIDFFTTFENIVSNADHVGYLKWIFPLVFIGFPVIAIFINLLAITHFYINKTNKELIISVQYRFKNLIIIFISSAIVLTFLIYVIAENIRFK